MKLVVACLLLTVLLISTSAIAVAKNRVDVSFALFFIDADPTRLDTVHANGRVVEQYWEGSGGAVSGDLEGTIEEWTSSETAIYTRPTIRII